MCFYCCMINFVSTVYYITLQKFGPFFPICLFFSLLCLESLLCTLDRCLVSLWLLGLGHDAKRSFDTERTAQRSIGGRLAPNMNSGLLGGQKSLETKNRLDQQWLHKLELQVHKRDHQNTRQCLTNSLLDLLNIIFY